MARPRKIIDFQTGNINKATQERRRYEESLIQSSGDDLDNVRPSQFVNSTAKKEYFRALKRLREEIGMVGNLNQSDLLAYANSYGKYMNCVKICRQKNFSYIVDTESGPKPHPVLKMMDDAQRCMGEAARRLGMTLNGQLKAAKAKADKEEAEMEATFGVI